jgi:hypothetical protein
MGGLLILPKNECEALASSDHLLLTLRESGVLYRMIVDAGNCRFIAQQL